MTQPSPEHIADDANWRRSNLGHLLFAATGQCVGAVLQALHAKGITITEAQMALFGAIDELGTRLTTLAQRAGLAKQSMIELIDRAEAAGWLTRDVDGTDTRAKIVQLTHEGKRLQTELRRQGLVTVDAAGRAIGAKRVVVIRRALARYLALASPPAALDQLLARAARAFVRDVLVQVHLHGYREITDALLSLFRQLDLDGSRLTELAGRARITKQSMGALVTRAEALGLVERAPDGADARASLIRFTADGIAMLEAFRIGVEVAEEHFVAESGVDMALLKAALVAYLTPSASKS